MHELTHAFDSLRKGKFKSVCHLIACGEIRASALGKRYDSFVYINCLGQCSAIEPEKSKYKCIWDDAVRSTELHCGTRIAEEVLKQVFLNCVKDKSPF